MAKKSVLLSLVILTVAALGATASAQLEGEPNCILIGYFPSAVCNCTSPGPVTHQFGSTYSVAWWKHTGSCAEEGEPCPWEYGGISGPHQLTAEIPGGKCIYDVKFWWCVYPPGTLVLCENGYCPDGPKNYFNLLGYTAKFYNCP